MGLARNEAIAYLTLLEDDSGRGLTGYEVAARSGVPRSAVYAVLRGLEEAGASFCYGTEPARYVATEPEQWVERTRRDTVSRMEGVLAGLRTLPKQSRPEPIWILRRYQEVLDRIAATILTAEQSVYLSVWPRELEWLMPTLDKLAVEKPEARALHRVLHSPAQIVRQPPGFSCWVDNVNGDETKARWSHKALVVVDRREAIIGGTEPGADNHAVWTTNPSLVDVATNHIILDITLMARATGRSCVDDVAPMMRPHLTELVR